MTVGMGLQTILGVEMCTDDDDSIMYSGAVSVYPNNMIKLINVFSLSRVIVPTCHGEESPCGIKVNWKLIKFML